MLSVMRALLPARAASGAASAAARAAAATRPAPAPPARALTTTRAAKGPQNPPPEGQPQQPQQQQDMALGERAPARMAGGDLSLGPAFGFGRMSSMMDQMRREMDELMGGFGGMGPLSRSPFDIFDTAEDIAMPAMRRLVPVTMEECDGAYTVTAEVPGLGPQDVKVTVQPETRVMTISGARQEAAAPEGAAEGAVTRSAMSFVRSFRLPVDASISSEQAASARVKDGLLMVDVPKAAKPEVKVMEIPVQQAE